MKRMSAILLAFIFAAGLSLAAFSADIDGEDKGVEWDGATVYKIINGESNCGVTHGFLKVKFDNPNRAVFLCFMFIDPALEQGNTAAGISMTVEGSEPFVMTMSSSPQSYDIAKYSFDGAMSIDENNGATCEIRLGVKEGLPREIHGSVRYIDANGVPSNVYGFTLINEEYAETTARVISPTADNSDPAYNPNINAEKTTKSKKTTAAKTTTEKFEIKTSPPYSYVRKTKPSTTVLKTTAAVRTSEKTTKPKRTEKATVYYYEKEVIISQVIVTQPPETAQTDGVSSVNQAEPAIETQASAEISPKSGKYKIIAGVTGGVLLISVAAWGGMSGKGKSNGGEN